MLYECAGREGQTDVQARRNLYFRTVHVVIFILFKPNHALFLKHIHIHI